MFDAEGIKVLNPSESITENSKVLIEMKPEISKLVALKKPKTMIQRSKGKTSSEPNTFMSKFERK